jgi:uncharacterized protein
MSVVGSVDSLWRYPVKSMRGEQLAALYVGYSGVYGDRLFAFKNSAAPIGFPYLTARERHEMLTYRPRFRHPDKAAAPSNAVEAARIGPGLNPVAAEPDELALDVETPSGETLSIDDEALLRSLESGLRRDGALTLLRSERAMTDCRPVSLFSVQTVRKLGEEMGFDIDKRRFRANVYINLDGAAGYGEDAFVGRKLQIGSKVVVSVLERDPRCAMITLDPDTAAEDPKILRNVARNHEGMAGIYGAVLSEGMVEQGDVVELLD